MFDKLHGRSPINKTAAIVTAQSGCDDDMTMEDRRDTLARSAQSINRELAGLPKKHHYRAALGQRKFQIQEELSKINRLIKKQRVADEDLNEHILHECRRRITGSQWHEVLHAARGRKREAARGMDVALRLAQDKD